MKMKRTAALLFFAFSFSIAFGGISDGFLTADDGYQGYITWRSYNPPLVVDGGGALEISIRDNGRLIIQSTSTPLGMLVGGVYDIKLYNTSHLLYTGGLTELITIGSSATAELHGGSINLIKSMQFTEKTGADPHIDLYCQPGWSWLNNDPLLGIQGKWMDGSSFAIEFINDSTYDLTWTNINVITPEPATMLLLGLGGLLLRRRS
ncbi:PEP-CTERM sorting domain-containing protein [Anaerohalosphaeraceae bacterium U12dextr]